MGSYSFKDSRVSIIFRSCIQMYPFILTHMPHDDIIKWKKFPRYWPFVRGIHRWPVNFLHKGQWRGALTTSLIWTWINGWVNNRKTGDLRRYRAHYDITIMKVCRFVMVSTSNVLQTSVTCYRLKSSWDLWHCCPCEWNFAKVILFLHCTAHLISSLWQPKAIYSNYNARWNYNARCWALVVRISCIVFVICQSWFRACTQPVRDVVTK